jgi:sugar lactone lactonase YvrE
MRFLRVLAPVLCVLLPLSAVETQVWEHSDSADFEKGTMHKLSLSSEGRLTPAPVMRELYDPSVSFLWAIARDSKGNLYAGGGSVGSSKSKLIVVNSSGQAKTLVELDGMAIQAIAIDKQDRVYAATSPDGKVYRVNPAGHAEVFYDPHSKYIWALAFSSNGDLFVATGDQGEIHRVASNGTGSVFYHTEEVHVRSLAVDAKDNLIAGTDPSGLILRITPAGQGFVLYETPKREITTVAVAADGTVYAAGTGTKAPATAPPAPQRQTQASPGAGTMTVVLQGAGPGRGGDAGPPMTAGGGAPSAVPGGSDVYRVQPDGYARRIWTNSLDVVYALAFDAQGKLIAGTGNRGNIYRLDSDQTYTRLLNLEAAQVTGFAAGANGRLYAVTGNIGEIFTIGPERESSGTLESDVLDAGAFSYWGRMTSLHAGSGAVAFETRSGNVSRAQKDWSPWAKLSGDRVTSPAARFLQYRATVSGAAELYDVTAAYEMKNVAPVIEALESTPANYKFPAPVAAAPPSPAALTLPPLGRTAPVPAPARGSDTGASPALTYAKGYIGARWLASDENGDTLRFKIEIRGEHETAWKPLHENLQERYYSWDSTTYPDGKYRVRVTASDAPSNTPEQALTNSRESDLFLIDNTAPEISALTAVAQAGKIDAHFHAKDALNVLDKAEYSVNGGEWKVVEPTTRLTDSQEHDYRFQVDAGAGETTIAVRVSDAYDNQAVAKTVVK